MRQALTLLALSFSIFFTGCGKKSNTADDSSGAPGGGTPFTAAQISKAWVSDCTASVDSIIGTAYYKNYLTLNSDNTFMFQQYLHTGTGGSGGCNNANYVSVMTIYGAYSVGSAVGSAQAIAFTVTTTGGLAPDLMIIDSWNHTPSVNTIETAFNNDCGGTSPYCTLNMGSCTLNPVASGAHSASKSMSCMHYTFPNTGTDTIYNIGTYDGTTLTLGAGVTGVPGVFSAGSTPTTATVAYH